MMIKRLIFISGLIVIGFGWYITSRSETNEEVNVVCILEDKTIICRE